MSRDACCGGVFPGGFYGRAKDVGAIEGVGVYCVVPLKEQGAHAAEGIQHPGIFFHIRFCQLCQYGSQGRLHGGCHAVFPVGEAAIRQAGEFK